MSMLAQELVERIADRLGRQPMPLSGEPGETVSLLASGYVDLFLAQIAEDGQRGALHHIGRVAAGSALFPLPQDLPGWQPVLLPSADTHAVTATVDQLLQIGAAAEVEVLLREWLAMLFAMLPGIALPPKSPQLVTRGVAHPPLRKAAVIAPRATTALPWLRIVEGSAFLLGQAGLELPHARPLPLPAPAWVETAASVEALTTQDVIAEDLLLPGLHALYPSLFAGIAQELQQTLARERARLMEKERGDARRVADSMRQLGGSLNRRSYRTRPHAHLNDPLMHVMDELGAAQSIVFRAPPELLHGAPLRDPVASIARSSSVRYRRLALGAGGWSQSESPFLAFRASDHTPLACIPIKGRSYRVYDPSTETSSPLTEEALNTLEPFIFHFYRPFPRRAIGSKDLLLFGLDGSWKDLIVTVVVGLLGSLLGLGTPLITQTIFDDIIPGAQRSRLMMMIFLLFAALLSSAIFSLARSFAMLRLEGKMDARVQAAVWDRLMALPAPFFRKYSTGDLVTRGLAISAMRKMLTGTALSSLMSGIFSITSFCMLFYYSVHLALLAAGLTLIALVAGLICSMLMLRSQREMLELKSRIGSSVLQFLLSISKLRVSGTENRAFVSWASSFARQKTIMLRLRRIGNAASIFNAVFPVLATIAVFFLTLRQVDASGARTLTTGEFLAFNSAYAQFSGAVLSLMGVALSLLAIVPLYERARPILDALPEADPGKPDAGQLTGQLELSHVQFRYDPEGPLVLKDISVEIQPGEFVAFVGPSGSGKSTLLRLLLGFETPESGAVYFDGQDLQNIDMPSVRQQMGVVVQNASLISGDIYSNIACSGPYTLDEAMEAAKLAGFGKDLAAMPMGLHTVVGEGGAGFSGGQRQRLMIARAIVGKPRILLFDEATSAVDNQAQAIVSRSLEELNATRIVIAHRLSTIVNADRIYVIDNGRIVQSGTYQQLSSEPGLFADLAKRQLA